MPATRTHLTRDLKRREIVDSAEELFLADGYEKTSMAAVARGAGVASNAIYWYFPGKDDLLAAVLERRLEQAIAGLPDPSEAGMEEQVLAVLAQLDQVARLTAAVHERSRQSEAVASVHESFHGQIDGRRGVVLRDLKAGPRLRRVDRADIPANLAPGAIDRDDVLAGDGLVAF